MANEQDSRVSWSQLMTRLQSLLEQGSTKLHHNKPLILKLLHRYHSHESDFHMFCLFDDKAYTKNLVKASADTYNVIIMCWQANQCSLFHGHEGSRCFVKVLKGEMLEQLAPHPASTRSAQALKMRTEKVLRKNDVSYIDDNVGVHKMINLQADSAVTLHIYLPAYKLCRIFTTSDKTKEIDGSLSMEESQSIEVTFSSTAAQLQLQSPPT